MRPIAAWAAMLAGSIIVWAVLLAGVALLLLEAWFR